MHCAPFLLTMQIIFASVSYRRVVADLRNKSDWIEKTKIDLQNTVSEEVDQLAEIISFNGGHLTEDGKKYLDQLLAVSPDNYWLNLIKTKEK